MSDNQKISFIKVQDLLIITAVVLTFLFMCFRYNNLFFCGSTEIFNFVIVSGVFMITVTSWKNFENSALLIIGPGYLLIELITLICILSFREVNSVPLEPFHTTPFWLGARLLEALILLTSSFLVKLKIKLSPVLMIFGSLAIIFFISMVHWKVLPFFMNKDYGSFSSLKAWNYLVCFMLIISFTAFQINKDHFTNKSFFYLRLAVFFVFLQQLLIIISGNSKEIISALTDCSRFTSLYFIFKIYFDNFKQEPIHRNYDAAESDDFRKERDRLYSIFDSIPDCVYVINKDFKVEYVNPAMVKDFGENKQGVNCYEYSANRSTPCPNCKLNEGIIEFAKYNLYTSSSKAYDVIQTPLKNPDGTISKLKIYRDITSRIQMEKVLESRAQELQVLNKELEAFSYSVSHDLRAPLHVIINLSVFLLEDNADKLDSIAKDYLKRIISNANRMNDLIIDLLDLSRIARQELNIQELNLSTISARIIDDLRSKNPERKVHISIQPDLFTLGDERLIQIALTNLLENAWKYTLKTAEPVVEVYSKELDGNKTFCISDNGAGFSMSKADKLFKPFQRLHSDKEFKGTGIGLAIVARVINRHGGKIWVEAQEDKGATFLFQFPAVQKVTSSAGSLAPSNFV